MESGSTEYTKKSKVIPFDDDDIEVIINIIKKGVFSSAKFNFPDYVNTFDYDDSNAKLCVRSSEKDGSYNIPYVN